MSKKTSIKPFSEELETWLADTDDKTLGGLINSFEEKSFAIVFLVMMAIPALPLPTGGVTHLTEIIAFVCALQMTVGRKTIWLPQKWQRANIGRFMSGKAANKFLSVIKWFERLSRRRGAAMLSSRPALFLISLIVLIFIVAAFGAVPFSGLDTLPSLGVLMIALSLILEDIVLLIAGLIVGSAGIALELATGAALYKGFTHFF